ncbi:hypothetical protein SHKM778_87000 [Streptomyces sp. KM77-8]|uniref:Uncharacterized protein n=1 Tax=Streptomyces haneummycinicus TaxID=3074435 RepID=A0AAT9HXI6_9ACTN
MFAMPRTLTAPGNAEDPVVVRRRGPVREWPYAAVVLVELPEPDEPDEPAELDEPAEPAEEPAPESEEEGVDDEVLDGFGAGELLDEEPRLSLR